MGGTAPRGDLRDTPAVTGGLFLATEQQQSIRVGFDYAMLIDPSAVSPLKGNLSLSEIMYNPIGGDAFEYVELLNAGSSEVNLRDAQFDRGITYRFGNLSLAAGERIVVAKNRESFLSRYGTEGIRLAAGQFEGRLKNGGETIALIDARRRLGVCGGLRRRRRMARSCRWQRQFA